LLSETRSNDMTERPFDNKDLARTASPQPRSEMIVVGG
jgi:hypothetical protein